MNKVLNLFSSHDNDPDPVTGLTKHEKKLVGSSWNLVRKDLKTHGVELFLIFFKDFPEYQSLFPFRDVPYEELRTCNKLRSHGVTVMYAISSVVDSLSDSEVLVNILQKNAESHAARGITQEHYWNLKKAVMKLLREGLGSEFTKETEEAWEKTLTVAFTVITKAL